jgi:type II secretory ATPase GspE/PulE/Tfp pilus assembly ATPase PilB-like protein
MVGEIRDSETAEIAINSALTGHLVFSTLHTNSSAGTFPRLIDPGINPKVLGSAINVAMAQRLVRKLCDNCKEKVNIDQKNLNEVKNVLDNITDKSYLENIQTEYLFKAKGCEKCNNTGYKGRIGIYEMVVMDESIENIVKESSSEREIEEVSKKQGFLNMKEDGILKVLKGLTTIEELERIITIEN